MSRQQAICFKRVDELEYTILINAASHFVSHGDIETLLPNAYEPCKTPTWQKDAPQYRSARIEPLGEPDQKASGSVRKSSGTDSCQSPVITTLRTRAAFVRVGR